MVGNDSVRGIAFVTAVVGILHTTQFTPMGGVILGTTFGVALFRRWSRDWTVLRKMGGIEFSTRSTFVGCMIFETTNGFAIFSSGELVALSRGVISIFVLAKGALVSSVDFGAGFCSASSRAFSRTMVGRAIATAATMMLGVSLSTTRNAARLH